MNFLEALNVTHHENSVGSLSTALKSDDLPSDVQSDARAVASQMEVVDDLFDDFRTELATLPNYAQDRNYSVEGAAQLQKQANQKLISDNDPSRAIDRLETRIKAFLSELADRAKPIPPTTDPALLEALLLGARQDARDALSGTSAGFAEAVLNLQTQALEGSEDALAYLLGATPWAERYVKAHGSPQEQIDFDGIRGTLRDNVSDPSATPYRQAAERFAELAEIPEGYRLAWRFTLEESGLLLPEVATALGL